MDSYARWLVGEEVCVWDPELSFSKSRVTKTRSQVGLCLPTTRGSRWHSPLVVREESLTFANDLYWSCVLSATWCIILPEQCWWGNGGPQAWEVGRELVFLCWNHDVKIKTACDVPQPYYQSSWAPVPLTAAAVYGQSLGMVLFCWYYKFSGGDSRCFHVNRSFYQYHSIEQPQCCCRSLHAWEWMPRQV